MSKSPKTKLHKITSWLDDYLNHDSIADYPNAHNGLQVENSGNVQVVAAAVDASLDTIRKAAEENVDLLIVHHGLYWQGVEMLRGSWKEKCKLLLDNNIAVYSSHIPLDIHPEVGNNILLAKALGMTEIEHCIPWKNVNIGVKGKLNKNREQLKHSLTELLELEPFTCFRGENEIDELYLITGGAGTHLKEVYELGGKNFLSGEGSQWTVPYAEEKDMNYLLANHYATETFGVKELSKIIHEKFSTTQPTFFNSINQL